MDGDRAFLKQYLSEYRITKVYMPLESATIMRIIEGFFGVDLDRTIYDVINPDRDPATPTPSFGSFPAPSPIRGSVGSMAKPGEAGANATAQRIVSALSSSTVAALLGVDENLLLLWTNGQAAPDEAALRRFARP
ncbi:hypothetical protein GCM10009784_08220 [Arthrobacter parietis]|uniref:Uncharacterized protein n=1 Tax=Arthrobacter parietis TaxID=271434 RepID=A0ABP5MKF9_9MICC